MPHPPAEPADTPGVTGQTPNGTRVALALLFLLLPACIPSRNELERGQLDASLMLIHTRMLWTKQDMAEQDFCSSMDRAPRCADADPLADPYIAWRSLRLDNSFLTCVESTFASTVSCGCAWDQSKPIKVGCGLVAPWIERGEASRAAEIRSIVASAEG